MNDESTPRRAFLGQLALTTAGLTNLGRGGSSAPVAHRPGTDWDDSWTKRLGSEHRFVFDLAQDSRATSVFDQVTTLFDDYHTALNTRDEQMHFVLVIRHAAIALAFNDTLWSKYKLGTNNAQAPAVSGLQKRGVVVLACNMAAMNRAREFASTTKQEEAAVAKEVRENMLPGVILQPNGVYALHRAQDVGCVVYHVG